MLAVIGGSGAWRLLQEGALEGKELGRVETPYGPSAPLRLVRLGSHQALLISRHGERGYEITAPWVNYRANIWALKDKGATSIIAWSGPGSLNPALLPGSYALPDDLLDETHGRKSSFYEGTGLGFVRQNPVFCPTLRVAARKALAGLGVMWHNGGTYACTQGPRLETPAEIRKLRLFGADLVGMTLAPECFLARELEMCYLPICYVTNLAEGVAHRDYREGVLFEGLLSPAEAKAVEEAVSRFPTLITLLADHLQEHDDCPCRRAMERYRRSGRVSGDWRGWVKP